MSLAGKQAPVSCSHGVFEQIRTEFPLRRSRFLLYLDPKRVAFRLIPSDAVARHLPPGAPSLEALKPGRPGRKEGPKAAPGGRTVLTLKDGHLGSGTVSPEE